MCPTSLLQSVAVSAALGREDYVGSSCAAVQLRDLPVLKSQM